MAELGPRLGAFCGCRQDVGEDCKQRKTFICWNIAIPSDYNTEGDTLWPALDGRPPSASGGDLRLLDVLGFLGG